MTLYDKKDVAKMLKCSVSKVEKMMKAGEIGFTRVGSRVRFRPTDLLPFFAVDTWSSVVPQVRTDGEMALDSTIFYELLRGGRE